MKTSGREQGRSPCHPLSVPTHPGRGNSETSMVLNVHGSGSERLLRAALDDPNEWRPSMYHVAFNRETATTLNDLLRSENRAKRRGAHFRRCCVSGWSGGGDDKTLEICEPLAEALRSPLVETLKIDDFILESFLRKTPPESPVSKSSGLRHLTLRRCMLSDVHVLLLRESLRTRHRWRA